ncbi:MFS transporter [Promicromonospora sp. Populi]|uniref:MFS transporter n=1 Tax=Promicromonospora sp. Populi TaxID=3239420 RepID=UPI0034E297FF
MRPPVARLWTAVALGYVALGATLELIPTDLAHRLDAGASTTAAVTGVAFLATALARPFAGVLADAGRARAVVATGGLLVAAGVVSQMLGPTISAVVVGRLAMGVGEAALFSGALPWVLRGVPADRHGRVSGWFGLAMWSGLAAGPAVAVAARVVGGPTAAWWAILVAPLVSAVLVLGARPEPRRRAKTARPRLARPAWAPATYLGLAGYAYGTVAALLVAYLARDQQLAGLSLTLFSGGFLAVRVLGSPLVDRFGPVRTGVTLAVVEALALAALPVDPTPFRVVTVLAAGPASRSPTRAPRPARSPRATPAHPARPSAS